MQILIVSDAWFPQVNGVVHTLNALSAELARMGHEVCVAEPRAFRTVPCPTYPEIRLALSPLGRMRRLLEKIPPDAVHLATEGPLGWAARRLCLDRGWPFTTSFHTRFPEYVQARIGIPVSWGYAVLRRFHAPAARTLVATASLQEELAGRGFGHLAPWSRGVNTDLFHPGERPPAAGPIFLYVGRVAVEKNLSTFLKLDLPGTKVVVGDGPQRAALMKEFPRASFPGVKHGAELAAVYRSADVFVFPSRTDTYGLVMLEAMACGLPVAAYPVPGPKDMVEDGRTGRLDADLRKAALDALELSRNGARERCRRHALANSWRACAEQFFGALAPLERR